MIPVIVKLCESPSKAGGLLMINYTLEFKQDAAKLVNEKGYTPKQAAGNLGISLSAIGRWARAGQGPPTPWRPGKAF